MIDHVSLYVSDYKKAKDLYVAALAPLGYSIIKEFPEWNTAGFGADNKPDLWVMQKEGLTPGHVALVASGKETVNNFYDTGMKAGGTDNGKPGYRKEYTPGYYAAFIKDADGNNIEAVFHDPALVE